MPETERKTFVIHPGWVASSTDGDRHYIGVRQLERLYELTPWDRIIVASDDSRNIYPEDAIHLFPRFDGNYGRPT